ncbi:MAG: hypothetical protein OXG47_08640 [bacterium]|nr:hypothetical protein [bacterium]
MSPTGSPEGRNQRGGAISLWVVLMVPVMLGLGLAAMAVPQRLAAEHTVESTAADLATMAVVWRDTTNQLLGPLDGFPPDCFSDDAEAAAACHGFWGVLARDLNSQGVDIFSVRGFYGDSYTAAPEAAARPPCRIYGSTLLLDANHVAIAADWYGDWAARQLWPDGVRMASESVGHLNVLFVETEGDEAAEPGEKGNECDDRYRMIDDAGVPQWLDDPQNEARLLSESLPYRTVFEG